MPRNGSARESLPPPIATGSRLDFSVPISAKNCSDVRFRALTQKNGVVQVARPYEVTQGAEEQWWVRFPSPAQISLIILIFNNL
jgi:hypothetical protein